MKLLEKPYLTIEYDREMNCILQHWKGFAKSEEFREGILQSLNFFKQMKADKIISDTRNFSVVKREDTDWVAKDITPLLVKSGLKKMAFILPASAFTQISVNNFKKEANQILTIQYFDSLTNAKEWLASVQEHA